MTRVSPLKIRALGEAGVWVNGEPVRWRARPSRDLLFFLLSHPEGRRRQEILSRLWGLEPSPQSYRRLRLTLHRLRAALGGPQAVLFDPLREHLRLNRAVLEASDLYAFQAALRRAEQAREAQARVKGLGEALTLYGEFMAGEEGEWVQEARQTLRQGYAQAAVELALELCMVNSGSCDRMAQVLVQALRADPYLGEDYHQWLIRCLAQAEGKYAALEHYRRFVGFLREQLEEAPTSETRELAARIRRGEPVSCAPPQHLPHGFDCPLTPGGPASTSPSRSGRKRPGNAAEVSSEAKE